MAGSGVVTVYGNGALTETTKQSPFSVKVGLAQMLRGGVIMDVVNAEQARIAEEAGACAVMALERVPADIRAQGGVARMSDPQLIKEIKQAVTIPVMAKARIGHFVEAQILEAIGVDYVDESEVLTLADDENHINKHNFRIPFVCGCRNLGEALRRIREGAAMIRTKGEAGTGNIIEAVRHVRSVMGDIRVLRNMDDDEVFTFAKKIQAPYDLVMQTKQLGRLPVVHFAAGGVATPADAALMMQLGCDGVFVGSGIFKSGDPAKRGRAIVQAVTHYSDPQLLAEISCGLGEAMVGINLDEKVERGQFSTLKAEDKAFIVDLIPNTKECVLNRLIGLEFQEDANRKVRTSTKSNVKDCLEGVKIETIGFPGHNSYLTGNQLSSDCSIEPIKKALKKGVRVIELDLWPNITKDDIDVCHGGTLTTPVKLGKCLKAIKEDAFSFSEYPVILTFEDHLHPCPHLQEKVAQMVKSTFGSMLFIPKSDMDVFPSPNKLMKRILISTKPPPKNSPEESDNSKISPTQRGRSENGLTNHIQYQQQIQLEEGNEDEVPKYRDLIAIHATKHKGGMENFGSHGSSNKVGRCSMDELALEDAVAEHSPQLIRFTQRNILRVYPKGARVDSSNYDPLIAWLRGAQMVAFNMQGYDRFLWMMQGFFRANGGCGYVKKPDFLLSYDGVCDEVFNSMALPIKKTLKVKIYMGEGWRADFHFRHFDYCSPPDFYVRVGMVGVPADANKMRKTKTVNDQWIPIWNENEEFEFPIRVPELALLRIDVKDYDPSGEDEFAGQTCLPVSELRTGIRCVPLYNRRGDVYRSVKLLMRFDFSTP
ncbi:hypothetical protein H5410_034449 [Solanum commersonii]|uniref:Phosphoinositide phospholipase C n=1 Tax=Solanum commersonii TaxID=4109 RepID=A0A9J5YTF1_SOLCO|nr:hypothetical protein H5410_034449 [Solanum commersonii]